MKNFCLYLFACTLIGLLSCETINEPRAFTHKDEYREIAPRVQLFVLRSDTTTELRGENGTNIILPAHCYVTDSGKLYNGPVTIKLIEYYSITDMIFGFQTTYYDSSLLQTNGMIQLSAHAGSQELHLRKGYEITIAFPLNGRYTERMKLFMGTEDTLGYTRWDKIISDSCVTIEVDSIVSEDGTMVPFYQKNIAEYVFRNYDGFGSINCDMYPEAPGNGTASLKVNTEIIPGSFIIFPDLRCLAAPKLELDSLKFYNLPSSSKCVVINFYKNSKGEYYYFEKSFDNIINKTITPIYKQMTLDEIKRKVDLIKWSNFN